jgi:membrane fusion protein, multidrug efflux system
VTPNTAFSSVVDLSIVRLVANVVEKDLRQIKAGLPANVEVDAYPGEKFAGKVAHVAPVLDPATRTASIEVEIENPNARLKPGMYAKVEFNVDHRDNTLVVPASAVVDVRGSRGVFQPSKGEQGDVATFKPIEVGLSDANLVEVIAGLGEGETIVTTGAAALREGDRIILPGQDPNAAAPAGGGRRGNARGGSPRGAAGDGGRSNATRGGQL